MSGREKETERVASSSSQIGFFYQTGEYWTLGLGGATFPLKDLKGLSYVQRLLQHPREEFHALDLLRGLSLVGEQSVGSDAPDDEGLDDDGVRLDPRRFRPLDEGTHSVGGLGDAGALLDSQAKKQYRRAIEILEDQLKELRERGEHEGAQEAETKLDFLRRELARGVGIGGRERRAGSYAERARLSVKRAIDGALEQISKQHAALGGLLHRTIRTGSFCSYVPDQADWTVWRFAPDGPSPSVEIALAGPISSRRYTSFLQAFAERASFVGREEERAALLRGLDRAQGGKGKIFLIEGALGVGKTRISLEIMETASERGLITLTGSCFEGANPDPFNPFIEAIERALASAGSPDVFRRALGEDARDLARLMPQLRRVFSDIPHEEQVSPEQARRAMFNAVVNLLFRFSVTAPVLLLLEDLHWADEGTLSLLTHIGRSLAQVPIMILGTLRDSKRDLTAPLGRALDELTRLHILERLSLGGLSRAAVGEMIQSLAKHSPPESLVNLFYETTEGNPLFVEELFADLVQHGKLLDSDGVFLPEIVISDSEVPPSLRLVLGRKLSALSTNTRNLLTAASVIGRSFTLEELQALTGEDAERLIDCVEEAEGRGIISSTLEERQVRFQFSHQLIRNTVLADVSTVRRQRLHAKYAGALEVLHSSDVERKSAEIAQHLVHAGTAADPGKTFQYLTLAARRAITQSAFEAALSYLQKARAALECLAPSRERDEQELRLYFEYLPVISMLNRWTAPEAGKIYDRARELSHNLGQNLQMYRLLLGSATFHLGRGELDRAELYVHQTFQLASASAQHTWSTGAQIVLGHVLCCRGQFASAHERLTTAIRLQDSIEGAEPSAKRAKIRALGVDGMVLWMLGYARQAISSGEEAIQLASAANNPFDLVLALTQAHIVALLARQYGRALDLGDQALALATRVKFEYLQISMTWSRDACRILARVDNNIDAVRNDFKRHHEAEAQLYRPTTCTVLAECCGLVGQTEAGLAMVEEAFKCAAATGQRMSDADTWRVKGALLLQLADKAGTATADSLRREAEECFLEGIEVARRQQARSWELRTTLSLSHLLIHSGREKQAKDMLCAAHTRLTEGFDFPDLVEAARLLSELQSSSRS